MFLWTPCIHYISIYPNILLCSWTNWINCRVFGTMKTDLFQNYENISKTKSGNKVMASLKLNVNYEWSSITVDKHITIYFYKQGITTKLVMDIIRNNQVHMSKYCSSQGFLWRIKLCFCLCHKQTGSLSKY